MASKVIHYLHPSLLYHACGMGDINFIEVTSNFNEVTCKRCRKTVAGRNAGGKKTARRIT